MSRRPLCSRIATAALASLVLQPPHGSTSRAQAAGGINAGPPPVVVRSAWGELVHGKPVQILGEGFGQHALDIQWLGGWLEQQAEGVNPDTLPGWGHLFRDYAVVDQVSAQRAWSGSKSLLTAVDKRDTRCGSDGCYESTLQYVHPTQFQRIYATWWLYFEPLVVDPAADTQWKSFRINSNYRDPVDGTPTPVNNLQGDVYWPMYVNAAGLTRSYLEISCFQDCGEPWYECWRLGELVGYREHSAHAERLFVDGGTYDVQKYGPSVNGWSRIEVWADSGTMDAFDGSMTVSVVKPDAGRFTGFQMRRIKFFDSKVCRNPTLPWKTLIFQNMFDSNGSPPAVERANIYTDDIYLQFETRARVELGDATLYEQCSRLEIQHPTAWTDTGITVTLNRGAFEVGARAYLYVIRDDGSVSSGLPITLH
jgi:hypothetical protein